MTCPACGHPVSADARQRFCGACGAALPASADADTQAAPVQGVMGPRPERSAGSAFLPGMVLAGRYRMIGPLGRGGMGEVYRADDLKLGQPVALKFLPRDVERDPDRLDRFLTEVRMSLRVTHPNVCRVFDIGELAESSGVKRHFLSMEYVDGEDLSSLLRRIGRLPEDKAIEIARQLCAGLAAAHDEGVLHRDLKPANIMIDGRGRAKIADFGLAGASGISGREARAGTPQYMAPEQAKGETLTERTDIYALGLVLYELFTGKRAFDIRGLEDLAQLSESTPTSPSSHVTGLNVLVERAILRCLETDPGRRPSSASALAGALPGGDPLAMAIAAGDTPSPEMVAAAGSDAGLKPRVAGMLLALTIAGGIAVSLMASRVVAYRAGAPARAPAVLIEQAQQVFRLAGVSDAADSAWGLELDVEYRAYLESGRSLPAGQDHRARSVLFWIRQSPVFLERYIFLLPDVLPDVHWNDPAIRFRGEARAMLDREGRLVRLEVMPPQQLQPRDTNGSAPWAALFEAAGFDFGNWTSVDPAWTPSLYGDQRFAWVPSEASTGASETHGALRIEASTFQGHPVSFQVIFPWTLPFRDVATRRTTGERIGNLISILILSLLMLGSAVAARRNLRQDRADRRGAMRLGVCAALAVMGIWVIDEHHVPTIWEMYLFLMAVSWAAFVGLLLSAFYLALEPAIRRTWPSTIMSWSRVMAGDIRDPLVARDVLIGCAVGAALWTVDAAGYLTAEAVSGIMPRLFTSSRPFLGAMHVPSELAWALIVAIFVALAYLLVLFVARRFLRNEWLAIIAGALLLSVPFAFGDAAPLARAVFVFAVVGITLLALARVGLVVTITALFMGYVLQTFPLTVPGNTWYSNVGFAGILAIVALAVTAYRIATTPSRTRTST